MTEEMLRDPGRLINRLLTCRWQVGSPPSPEKRGERQPPGRESTARSRRLTAVNHWGMCETQTLAVLALRELLDKGAAAPYI
jgi:hypothetical protein